MFAGLTAWFSASIGHSNKQKWLDHGGVEIALDDAEFIFSADAGCEDTERIFSSEPYLDEHLSVFHPNYIDECIKLGGPKDGLVGKYILPPKDVQTLIRDQMSLQWDIDGHTSDSDLPKSKPQKPDQPQAGTSSGITHSPSKPPPGNNRTRTQSAPTSKPANQSNNHPGTNHQSNNQQRTNHKIASVQSTNHTSANHHVDRSAPSSVQQEQLEYLRLEDLAQSAGELLDFVPGHDGCDMVIK